MDDVDLQTFRKNVLGLKFGWMKFQLIKSGKNAKFIPGFVYPKKDGKKVAQWVLGNGRLSKGRKECFDFGETIPEDQKESSQKSALRKFNETYQIDFK